MYGKTKLAGEQAIQAVGIPSLIFRSSWVYSARGKNFMRTILRLAKEREELRIVNDQFGAPTWSRMIAEATAQILAQIYVGRGGSVEGFAQNTGIYHLTAGGETSWYGFAKAILENVWREGTQSPPRLIPISTAEYPLPAVRPTYSVLSNEKCKRTFGIELPQWKSSLGLC